MKRLIPWTLLALLAAAGWSGTFQAGPSVDILLTGGKVLDGAGNPWSHRDVGIRGDRIAFLGDAQASGVTARETIDCSGLLITPGFWDVHSHADLDAPHGRRALPLLYQGVTTIVLGVDGGGASNVAEIFDRYRTNGIAVNALRYVGHGAARAHAMGAEDREPGPDEMARMKAFVERGMREGAVGLSTGLFYSPGWFAKTNEVVDLARVAAKYGGSYDTHDRDLGVAYKGIGYLASIREAIEIGERAGTPVIFSHFNAQGVKNYGRAPEGARLVEEARARGVPVFAGQHVYTATSSSLAAYALPRWAVVGGNAAMRERFGDPESRSRLLREIPEMLADRGGAGRIVFSDLRPELNGRTLAEVARDRGIPEPEAVLQILSGFNPSVMNMDLYDAWNTEHLAAKEWMMTCTDGFTPEFGRGIVHPRSYGGFTKKLRDYVYDRKLLSLPFAVRGMTSLAAGFYGIHDRGLVKPGFFADLAVFDEMRIRDRATYEDPHRYSEGTVHVIINGSFAFRDGKPAEALAGRPIPSPAVQ